MGGWNISLIGILFRDLDGFYVYFSLLSQWMGCSCDYVCHKYISWQESCL